MRFQLHRYGLILVLLTLSSILWQIKPVAAQDNGQYFPETGHTVSGKFLEYWKTNGGLATYGYPITDAQMEVDPETGKTFLTQWFERNRFELHPENAGTKYEVLLGLLGKDLRREALVADADFRRAMPLYAPDQYPGQQIYFQETGHNLTFDFYDYWKKNGGLERFGYPISEVHSEVDPETNQIFAVQWFERTRFEYHPENQPPYNILLGLLGKQIKTPPARLTFSWRIGPDYKLNSPASLAIDGQDRIYILNDSIPSVLRFDNQGQLLSKWEALEGKTNHYSHSTLAIDRQSNEVYLIGNYDNGILKYDAQGHLLAKITPAEELDYSNSAAIDRAGNLYIGGFSNGVIQKFDRQGKLLLKWQINGAANGQFTELYDLVLDAQGNVYTADSKLKRIQKFDSQGNFLFQWGSEGQADGQFRALRSLAVDGQGKVYASDSANKRIQKFDSQGNFLLKWGSEGTGDGQFGRYDSPQGLAVDSQGNVFVADTNNGRIQKFSGNGAFLTKWGPVKFGEGVFDSPGGMVTDPQGNLYVTDSDLNQVQKFDRNGRFLLKWGSKGSDDGQFNYPIGMAIDAQGNLYVGDSSNNRIQKFDQQGHFLGKWDGSASGDEHKLYSPSDVAIDGQGLIYVMDKGGNRIQWFDPNGKFQGEINVPTYGDARPCGLAVDSKGNIYISDAVDIDIQIFDHNGYKFKNIDVNHSIGPEIRMASKIALDGQGRIYVTNGSEVYPGVKVFSIEGQLLAEVGNNGPGSAAGQFYFPTAMTVDAQGNLYVGEYTNARLQKFAQHW